MNQFQEEALGILGRINAVIKDRHFVYKSGKHGRDYVDKDVIFSDSVDAFRICEMMATLISDNFGCAVTVIGPSMGAIAYAGMVCVHLGREAKAAYAEKQADSSFLIRPSFIRTITNKKVVVVEDILTTGGSAARVAASVKNVEGAEVVGVVAICNRGGVTAVSLGVPFLSSVVNVDMLMYEATECPLCLAGVPLRTDLGHGKEFLASLQQQ